MTTITGSLKISRSFPIVSLDFFKKLVEIQGVRPAESEAKWDELKDSHYSLEILENENLQKLFPDGSNVIITQRLVLTYIYTPTQRIKKLMLIWKCLVKIFKLYQYEKPCNSNFFYFVLRYFIFSIRNAKVHKKCKSSTNLSFQKSEIVRLFNLILLIL